MKHVDLRTSEEIFDDMLSDDHDFDVIAERLGWTWGRTRRQYLRICDELGVNPDEE